MMAQTVMAQASMARGALPLKRTTARTFVGTPVAQKALVSLLIYWARCGTAIAPLGSEIRRLIGVLLHCR